MSLGEQIQGITDVILEGFGDATAINGQPVIGAFWDEAQPSKIQTFIDESEWGLPVYDVQLPAAVISAPYNLKNGSELVWVKRGWRFVVRRLDPPGLQDVDQEIVVLAVMIPE